jgi:hypothetical protein
LYLQNDEWRTERDTVFQNLVQHKSISEGLAEAALAGDYLAIVTLSPMVAQNGDTSFVETVEHVHRTHTAKDQEPVRTRTALIEANAEKNDETGTLTVGGWLAFLLKLEVEKLERAEKDGQQPGRGGEHLPRSVISEVAVDMLEDCFARQYSPTLELLELVRVLLKVDRPKAEGPRRVAERERAIQILADDDKIPRSQLAKSIGVHRSTIYEWMSDPEFMRQVEDRRNKRR